MTAWGKAGVRLTEEQQRQRRTQLGKARWDSTVARQKMLAEGHRIWAAGKITPTGITFALGDSDGPGVDLACLAVEPEVDHWEAGILYPTWEQTVALADYCHVHVAFLALTPVPIQSTTLWIHMDEGERKAWQEPVLRFTQDALERRLGVNR